MADACYAVIGRDGVANERISAIGHPLRGAVWESNAIPELLPQAIELAKRLGAPQDAVQAA